MKADSTTPQVLRWFDVEDASDAFRVWAGGSEREWAATAWEHLSDAGLTTYTTQWERARVAVRFLALACLYKDWCCVVFGEQSDDDDLKDWLGDLDVSPLRLGQLIGEHPDFAKRADAERSYGLTEDDPTEEALQWLTAQARTEVADALIKGMGGTSALFLSLWRTNHPAPEPVKPKLPKPPKSPQPLLDASETLSLFEENEGEEDEDEDEEEDDEDAAETDFEVMNNPTPEKTEGFEWIEAGCYCVR